VKNVRSRFSVLSLCAGLAIACGGSAPKIVDTPKSTAKVEDSLKISLAVRTHTLSNGLRVILQSDRRTPFVAVNVWYHVGSKDDPPHRSGFAHLFEHLMFQGSRHVARGDHLRLLEAAGAQEHNGETDPDHTSFHETLPQNQLELALWLESDRMGFLLDALDQTSFAREREVVKNERRQRMENVAYGLVGSFTRAALYPDDHPYHRLTIGDPQDLDAATVEDVRAFWNRYYAPNDATLALVGDFDEKRTLELVEKYFAPIPAGRDPLTVTSATVPKLAKAKRVHVEAGVEFGRVTMTWPAPALFSPSHCRLAVLDDVLRGPLERELVTDKKIARSVSARHHPAQLGSELEITLNLAKDADPERAITVLQDALEKIGNRPFPTVFVKKAASDAFTSILFALESPTSRANVFNLYQQTTGDPIYAKPLLKAYDAVDADAVKKTFVELIVREKPVITIVTPVVGAPIAGRLVKASS